MARAMAMAIKRVTGSGEMMKRRWTEEDAAAVFSLVAASGLTLAHFAVRHGIEFQRLERWRRRLGDAVPTREEPAVAFEELKGPLLRSPTPRGRMEVMLRDGRVMRLDPDFDADAVRRLLAVLEGASC